jgi:DNA-binding CsgD family transcriptional regulator
MWQLRPRGIGRVTVELWKDGHMLRRLSRMAALLGGAAALVTISSLMPMTASASAGARTASTASTSVPSLGAEQAAMYPIQRTLGLTTQGSCAALRSGLSRLASDGLTSAACTRPAPASFASHASALPAASLCVAGRLQRTRHAACALTAVSYEVVQVPSGDVLGTGVIVYAYSETLSNKSWNWSLRVAIELIEATGVVMEGTVGTTVIHCTERKFPSTFHLTPVERQIALLVAQGMSNREIGTKLYRSEHTVAEHIRVMRQRVGARNRAHLVALTLGHIALTGQRSWDRGAVAPLAAPDGFGGA